MLPNAWCIHGPPGCGKTTHVAQLAAEAARQYGPERVLVASLTRGAAHEIRSRDCALPAAQIGTLHAFAFRALGGARGYSEAAPDFDHLLERACNETHEAPGAPAVIILDEAQDHSPLDLRLACHWARRCERLVLVGDPDQAIYGFRGADGLGFQAVPPERRAVLARSYRLPRAVHRHATGWIAQVKAREAVVFEPRDAEGRVRALRAGGDFAKLARSVRRDVLRGRSVMVLAACRYLLVGVDRALQESAPAEPWWRRFLARCRRPGAAGPAGYLTIGTIHSVKGGEADVVYVLPDLSPAQWGQWTKGDRDALVRLFYVAFTRAREELVLVRTGAGKTVGW